MYGAAAIPNREDAIRLSTDATAMGRSTYAENSLLKEERKQRNDVHDMNAVRQ